MNIHNSIMVIHDWIMNIHYEVSIAMDILDSIMNIHNCQSQARGGGGGYSLCDGWYICAAVLTPFFHFGRIEHDLFGVLFLIHQQQSYLLGYKNYQFLQKSIFLAPNSIFSSIFLGPIFSGQRHTPIRFQAEYPPPPGSQVSIILWEIQKSIWITIINFGYL